MNASIQIHIEYDTAPKIKVIADSPYSSGTFNALMINDLSIFATKEQLQEIADNINKALKEKEEVC